MVVVVGSKFSKSALEAPYPGPNSWGATYGEHKQFLEFSESQFKVLLIPGYPQRMRLQRRLYGMFTVFPIHDSLLP